METSEFGFPASTRSGQLWPVEYMPFQTQGFVRHLLRGSFIVGL